MKHSLMYISLLAAGVRGLRLPTSQFRRSSALCYKENVDLDLLPDDWRTYRARLVAKEELEKEGKEKERRQVVNFANFFSPQLRGRAEDEAGGLGDGDGLAGGEGELVSLGDNWAHPLTSVEPGSVLLANENLGGVFWQTVVLMLDVERGGKGATGLVVNRPLKGTLKDVARKGSNVAKTVQSAFSSSTCTYGGPVQPEDLAVLHSNPFATGAREVTPGVYVGGSEGLRKLIQQREYHGSKALFARGRSKWVPGQLDR